MKMSLVKSVQVVIKTGKFKMGYNNALKAALNKKCKLIVVANNIPEDKYKDLEYYCNLSSIPMVKFNGNSWELGAACGRPHMVSALVVEEIGDSDILKHVK